MTKNKRIQTPEDIAEICRLHDFVISNLFFENMIDARELLNENFPGYKFRSENDWGDFKIVNTRGVVVLEFKMATEDRDGWTSIVA